ncbi:prospero homeobox protein 1-like [Petromyzon marinus]|uniref:prospero homeobox protein 1-like n=1 Tax=Petromyzon marinus TaxID=7757 RepID=UPI003F71F4BC
MRGPARALPHPRRTKRRRLQLAAAATATAMMMMNAAVGDTAGASAPAPPAAAPLPPGAAERDVDAESSAVLRTLLRGDGRGGRHFHDDCSAYGAHLAHLKAAAAAAARRAVGAENGDGGNGGNGGGGDGGGGGGGGAAERRADVAFAGADDFARRPVPSSSPQPCASPSDRDRSPPAHGAQPPGAFVEPGSRAYDEKLHQVKRARVENIIRGISVSPGAALRDRDVAGAARQPPQEWEVGAGDVAGCGVSSMEQDEEEASGQLSPHDGQQRENKRKQRLPQQQQVQQQVEQAQQQQKLEERRRLKQQLEQLQKQLRHLQERFLQVYNHSSESDNEEEEEDNGDVDTSDEGVSSDVCESARRFSVDTTCHAGGQLNRTRTLVPVQGVVRESDRKGPGEAGKVNVPEGGAGGGRGWQLDDGKEFAETLKKKLTNSVSQVVDAVVHMFAPKQPAAGAGAGGGELAGPQSCAPLKTPVESSAAGPGAVAANGNEPSFLERRGLQRLGDAAPVAGARPGLPPPARAGSQRRAGDADDDDDDDVDQTEALSLVVRKLSPERPSTVVAYHHYQHQQQQHQQHRGERLPSPAIHHSGHGYPGASPLHHLPPGFPLHHHHHPGLSLPILAYTLAGGLDRVGPGAAPPPPQPPPPSFATSKLDSPPLELVEGLGRESHLGGGRLRGFHHHHQQHHHHHQQQQLQHHQQQQHHHHQQQLLMSHGQNNAPSPALTTASGDALSLAMIKSECGEQSDSADVSPYSATTLQEGLTPSHLKKAKLMFFYSRYPSSNMLKIYFSDVKFNRCITSQLIKWFSNFREFYYIQVEKFARQAITEGVTNVDELRVTRDCELFRALNVHYNKANDFEVPVRFLEVSEITLREFFTAITAGKDTDPSWKKAIYKVICKMDSEVPDAFRLSGCSQDSLLQ